MFVLMFIRMVQRGFLVMWKLNIGAEYSTVPSQYRLAVAAMDAVVVHMETTMET